MKKAIIIYFLTLGALLFSKFVFVDHADKIYKKGNFYYATGNAKVRYGVYGLKADTIISSTTFNRIKLLGNISIWDSSRYLLSQRAYASKKNQTIDKIKFLDKLFIDQDSILATSQIGEYSNNTKRSELSDSVSIYYLKNPSILRTPYLVMDHNTNIIESKPVDSLIYKDSIYSHNLIPDMIRYDLNNSTIYLDSFFKINSFKFEKKVTIPILKNKEQLSQFIYSHQPYSERYSLESNRGIYHLEQQTLELKQKFSLNLQNDQDTILIKGDKGIIKFQEGYATIEDNIIISNQQMNISCNRAFYNFESQNLSLKENPHVKYNQYIIDADSIKIKFKTLSNNQKELDKIDIFNGNIKMPINTTNKFNVFHELRGKNIYTTFSENSLKEADVYYQATAIYYNTNRDSTEIETVNTLSADTLKLFFNQRTLSKINASSNCRGYSSSYKKPQ